MRQFLIAAALVTATFAGFKSTEANARFSPQAIEAPALVEAAACTVRRVRTVRPNGRVVVRSVRPCGPGIGNRCRVVRERVVRPNGRVIVRSVRRCG